MDASRGAAGLTRDAFERLGGSLARLPGTAFETDSILAVFQGDVAWGDVTVLSQEQATEPALRDALGEYRYLHIATHGLVDEGRSQGRPIHLRRESFIHPEDENPKKRMRCPYFHNPRLASLASR